ncbi:cell division protein FtsQ [Salinivibrio sp. IB868]|uniref:cell division protein FtsQ/DivIB n=1 Tax=unclassified Salinivibrio TaxID=2636825 RepID=UPI000984C464|nr:MULTISPECIES: cell division protein FtsQ/DivIB [unclassified Salinivibrio]OOE66867.1 cell division protein FtsQ [Salinivibrio sp. IB868]OOE75739.1 cell division protein FtsQ [Salinivibrio sp. IB870]
MSMVNALTRVQAVIKLDRQTGASLAFLVGVITLMLLGLIRVIDWMSDEQQLPLSQLVMEGDQTHVSAAQVRKAVLSGGDLKSFMLQDVDRIQTHIEALPWVKQVAVRKQWPDTLKVHITEYQASAIWNGQKLLTPDGDVFDGAPQDVADKNLVSLHGNTGTSEEVLRTSRELEDELQRIGLSIQALSLNKRRSWRIVTRDGVRIELGRKARQERLARLVNLYPRIKAQDKAIEYVDLRYDTGAAVGWKTEADDANSQN